jgi:hypothetical protein
MNYQHKIKTFAKSNNLKIGKVQTPKKSFIGTSSLCAHLIDGKGLIYCHTSGAYCGKVFYVPLGIGWFYKNILKGSQSEIGLPVSNEFIVMHNVKSITFEKGTIEYTASTGICSAQRCGSVIKEIQL